MTLPWIQAPAGRDPLDAHRREAGAEPVSKDPVTHRVAAVLGRPIAELSGSWQARRFGFGALGRAVRRRGRRDGAKDIMRRYGAFWRETPDLLFALRVAPDGFTVDAINPAFEAASGVSHRAAVGRALDQVLPPDLAALVESRCAECRTAGAPITYTEAWPSGDGLRHWETTLTPLRDGHEAIDMILGAARNVSARQETQIALAQSEEHLRAAAELSTSILFTVRPDGAPDYLSRRFFAYTGLPADVDAERLLACVHPGDVARLTPLMKTLPPGPCQVDLRLRRADGVYRWFRLRAELIDGLAGPRWHGAGADVHDAMREIESTSPPDELLGSIVSGVSDRCITIDRQWRITSITPQALAWGGLVESDLLGIDARLRLPISEPLRQAIEASLASGQPAHVQCEATLRPGRWVEYHVYPFADGASVLFGDVTDRRLALSEFGAVDGPPGGTPQAMTTQIVLLDERGVVVAVNEAWRSLQAVERSPSAPYGVGSSYLEMCRKVFPSLDEAIVQRGLRGLIAGHRESFSQTYRVGTPGGPRWRQMRISQFSHGAGARFIAIHEDVTEVTRAQAALRETTEQLLLIQDEERHRIAIELHDSTSQHLVALGMGVARLRRTIGMGAGAVLDDMAGSLREAIREIRVISYLMNPPALGRDGLEATARQFVRGFGLRTGLNVAFRAEGALDALDLGLQHTAFRVVQESLSNVYRHAAAMGVEVELANRAGQLILRIADDGKGIARAAPDDPRGVQMGVGIPGMRARVAQFGGTLKVAKDGAGTVVSACIPLVLTPARPRAGIPSRGAKPAAASLVFGPAYAERAVRDGARGKARRKDDDGGRPAAA